MSPVISLPVCSPFPLSFISQTTAHAMLRIQHRTWAHHLSMKFFQLLPHCLQQNSSNFSAHLTRCHGLAPTYPSSSCLLPPIPLLPIIRLYSSKHTKNLDVFMSFYVLCPVQSKNLRNGSCYHSCSTTRTTIRTMMVMTNRQLGPDCRWSHGPNQGI